MYRRSPTDEWSVRNYTNELSAAGARPIISDITVFFDLTDQVYVAGLDTGGDLVIYRNTQVSDGAGQEVWDFIDIVATQLAPKGLAMPVLTGELISYVTAWNGLNVAALDGNGDIWAYSIPTGLSFAIATGGWASSSPCSRFTVSCSIVRSETSGRNCFGRCERDSGQSRVPEPPHRTTGTNFIRGDYRALD